MGLDGVELILHIEDSFGISISDEEAGNIHTVEDLYHCVITRMEQLPVQACLSSHVFYRLRRTLMDRLGVARRSVRPATPMDSLLPDKGRRKVWHELTSVLGPKTPALITPAAYNCANGLLFVGMVLIGVVRAAASHNIIYLIGYLLAGWIICTLADWMASPWATRLPRECATAGGLVKTLLRDNYGLLAEEGQKCNEREVRTVVKGIIVEELGVRPEEVTPNARIYEDLNAG